MDPKFKKGDRLIVTGDTDDAGHEFELGAEVIVTDTEWDENVYASWGYRCECVEPDCDDDWWVGEPDLEYAIKPASDDEVEAAIASIVGDR